MTEQSDSERLERVAMQVMYNNDAVRSVEAARDQARELLRIADGDLEPDPGAAELWRRITS